MTALKDYRLEPGKTSQIEDDAAALILVYAHRHKRLTVELQDAEASDFQVGMAAASSVLLRQIGEALRDGRLTIDYPEEDAAPEEDG